ncbi:MAG: hypothetical protein CM1200mP4_3420 [Rhodospirillaceae bacterium]|nr:MAG: hypothetical protein CM1200mP4_3420 [Rhodospirillaceae bacterium]
MGGFYLSMNIIHKGARSRGLCVWHQDGQTHWKKPDLDEYTHGFNFMAQLYGCNALTVYG